MVDDAAERGDAGGVDQGDVGHVEDIGAGFAFDAFDRIDEAGDDAEEEGAAKTEDFDILGEIGADILGVAGAAAEFGGVVAAEAAVILYFDDVGHAVHEEKRGHDHADFDGGGEIDERSENEGDDEDGFVAARAAQELGEMLGLAHIPCDHDEDGGEAGERDITRERGEEEHENEEKGGVEHAGDGGIGAGADIGRRARDGARGGKAAEADGGEIGQAPGRRARNWSGGGCR